MYSTMVLPIQHSGNSSMEMATSKEETWSACGKSSAVLHDIPLSIVIRFLATSQAHPNLERLLSQSMIPAIYES